MKAIRIAQIPPPTIPVTANVKESVDALANDHGCAAAIMDGTRLVGILSKDNVLTRIVATGRNPETTRVSEIMTAPFPVAELDTKAEEALKMMLSHRQCYLPVVDGDGNLKAWLAICHLFQNQLEDMSREVDSLEAYIAADGPGG